MNEQQQINKILSDAEKLEAMVRSDGWIILQQKFNELIINLSDITKMNTDDADRLRIELLANKKAIEILINLLNDIKGDIQRGKSYKDTLTEIKEETVINIFQ